MDQKLDHGVLAGATEDGLGHEELPGGHVHGGGAPRVARVGPSLEERPSGVGTPVGFCSKLHHVEDRIVSWQEEDEDEEEGEKEEAARGGRHG